MPLYAPTALARSLARPLRPMLVAAAFVMLAAGCNKAGEDAGSEGAGGGGVVQSAAAAPAAPARQDEAARAAAEPTAATATDDEATATPEPEPAPEPVVEPWDAARIEAALATAETMPSADALAATLRAGAASGDALLVRDTLLLTHRVAEAPAADVFVEVARTLLDGGKPALARRTLIAGEREHPGDGRFAALIEEALEADPAYLPEMRTLVADEDLDAIKYLGGGSTIVLRFIKDKKTFAAFKPIQKRGQTDPRAEIAAWRICPLVRCGFDIPYNEPVRLEWRAFDGLYSRLTSSKQKAYREANFDALESVRDDEGNHWVEGTMKAWIPSFTDYPIEISQIWRPWMLQENELAPMMEGLAIDAVDPIRKIHPSGDKLIKQLASHMGAMPRTELARQISNLIVYDYLINNWDRFSGAKDFWGVNCQFAHGRFMSIDNGASFARTPNEKVDKQLRRLQRFSRQMITAVRALDHDQTLARLFPQATGYELERFETFWSQREQLLAYVDELIAEHGEAAVLAFE